MKSKYTKIKYTNTGVKAPVITKLKTKESLYRSDVLRLSFEEMTILIERKEKKTMYTVAKSTVCVLPRKPCIYDSKCLMKPFIIMATVGESSIIVQNMYIVAKMIDKANDINEETWRLFYDSYEESLYRRIIEVIVHAKESE